LRRAVDGDVEAKEQMCLASTAAGVGFGKIFIAIKLLFFFSLCLNVGNAGVHLCHAMSYPIASNVIQCIF
jgi:alcohol dehydrogenase class IV